MSKYSNMYDRCLREMPYAHCGVNVYGTHIEFISYETLVIRIDNDGWLEITGTYSPTTRKQIGRFLKEYVSHLCYHDVKIFYERNLLYNIYTGEVKPIV